MTAREVTRTGLPLAVMTAFAIGVAAADLTDPTRPPDYRAISKPTVSIPREVVDYRLSAVKFSGGARWAIINGEHVAPGGKIGPATVLDIQPAAVVLDYEGERLTLNLLEHRVKNPAGTVRKQSVKP